MFELVEQEDDSSIGFVHHRYQEYFTARHIDENGENINWPAHIDEARWQETIIHLTSSSSGSPAIEAISQSIADVYSQVDAKDPAARAEQERRVADRIEFASKVARSYNARTFAALPGLIDQCIHAILWLVQRGNPITQVKMLWASVNLPPFDRQGSVFEGPLHSKVQWVRRQALIILTSRQALRSSPSNFGYELALDLAENVFLRHAFSYWPVVRRSRGLWPRWCYAWAWICVIGSTLALVAVWLLTVRLAAAMVLKAVIYYEIANGVFGHITTTLTVTAPTVTAIAASLLATTCFIFHLRSGLSLALVTLANALVMILVWFLALLGIVVGLRILHHLYIPGAVLGCVWLFGAPTSRFLFAIFWAVTSAWDAAVVGIYALGTWPTRGTKLSIVHLILSMFDEDVIETVSVGFAIVAAITALGFASYWIDRVPTSFWTDLEWASLGLVVVSLLAIVVVVRVKYREVISRKSVSAAVKRLLAAPRGVELSSVLVAMILLVFFIAVAVGAWRVNRRIDSSGFSLDIDRIGSTLTWAIAGMVAIGAAVAIGFGGWVGVRVLREQIVGGHRELDEWRQALASASNSNDPHRQAALLRGANHSTFSVAPRAFWEALVAVEGQIRADPASTLYWQRRREVEQILRRARPGKA